MPITDHPNFRSRLAAAHQLGNPTSYDGMIYHAATRPAETLTSANICRGVVFALEVFAAHYGQPHPCLEGVQVDRCTWGFQRLVADLEKHAASACFQISQSPFCEEFADDVRQLRPRLFRIAQAVDAQPRESPIRQVDHPTGTNPK